jgi:hypothetical protein
MAGRSRSRFPKFNHRRKPLSLEALEDRRLMSVTGWTASTGANPGLNPPLDPGSSTEWTDPTDYGDEAHGWDPLGGGDNPIVDPGNQDWDPFKKEALIDVPYYEPFDKNKIEESKLGILPGMPVLDSRPGAPHTLYLNFTGSRMKESFTDPEELGSYDLVNHRVAFDFDGDSRRFSDAEADAIYRIWRYVADDYAPFNVNVTTFSNTDQPSLGGDREVEVAIGGFAPLVDGELLFGISPRGYYNVSTERAVFVFSDRHRDRAAEYDHPVDAYEFFVKSVADTASHESGHLYGLKHKIGLEYGEPSRYRGVEVDEHGPRTAIMGRPFAQRGEADARSLWAEGQIPDASMQRDVDVLNNVFRMIGQTGVPDDFPDANYFVLPEVGAGHFSTSGVIGVHQANLNAIDEDWLAFFNPGGPVQIHLQSPAGMFGNLHSKIELVAAHVEPAGMVADRLVHASHAESTTHAFGSLYLPEGWYMINVTSTGGYGNLGAYELNVNAPGTPGVHVPGPMGEIVDVSAMDFFVERAWQVRPELAHVMGFASIPIITEADMVQSEIPPLASTDFSGDGVVDGADFLAWQRNLGRVDATAADGDANGDGAVDGADLAAWNVAFAMPSVEFADEPATESESDVNFIPPVDLNESDSDEPAIEEPLEEPVVEDFNDDLGADAEPTPAESEAALDDESESEAYDPWAGELDADPLAIDALDEAFAALA